MNLILSVHASLLILSGAAFFLVARHSRRGARWVSAVVACVAVLLAGIILTSAINAKQTNGNIGENWQLRGSL